MKLIKVGLLGALFALSGASAFAQESEVASITLDKKVERPKHIVGGHLFLPSVLMPNPFSDTTALLSLAFGGGTYSEAGNPNEQNLKLLTFGPRIDFQLNIWNRLAISLGLNFNMVTGMNGESLIRYGATVRYSKRFGAIYEIIRAESDVLSLALDLSVPHTVGVSPLDAAREAVTSFVANVSPDYVSDKVDQQWRPSIRYAHAISRPFGIEFQGGARINSTRENAVLAQTRTRLNFGFKGDFDLNPLVNVGIGFSAAYLRSQLVSGEGDNADAVTIGIFDTIKDDFNVGLELGKLWVGSTRSTSGALTFKTYYN